MLQRKNNWAICLDEAITAKRHVPFEWGVNDCCTFTGDLLQAIYSVDVFAAFRGQYGDELSAQMQIKGVGKTLYSAVSNTLKPYGFVRKSLGFAQRGDLVMTQDNAMGIVALDGRSVVCLTEKAGVIYLPLAAAKYVWGA
jgi:hypothetical protein